MSTVTPDQVRALIETELEDVDLQALIDREEAWLATQVGPLTGARTVTFYPGASDYLMLPRYATDLAGLTVTDAGATVTNLRLAGSGFRLRRETGWLGTVTVAYTPGDRAAVENAVIDLIKMRLADRGYQSEQIGSYGYSTGGGLAVDRRRQRIVRTLRAPGNARTISLARPVTDLTTLPTP